MPVLLDTRIQYGAAHFRSKKFKKKGVLEDVDYKVMTKTGELP